MHDVIIIGAGHNGLTAAAYLARAGKKVLVLERNAVVGGAAVTGEVGPGYRVSTASYLIKPYQEDQLLAEVRDLLAERRF
jgi:phytoene dehydrogenase-like protein